MKRAKVIVGAWMRDVPGLWQRTRSGDDWVTVVNRLGNHSVHENPLSVRCLENHTSSLHVAEVLPWTGGRLLKAAEREWSFEWSDRSLACHRAELSVIIPIRGTERLSLLKATIASLASMKTPTEIIVVEQDQESKIGDLPPGVRHIHAPHPNDDPRWHKCFAYNRGAEQAKGDILICHDGDIIVPTEYDASIKRHLCDDGQDVFYPGRFLFYLSEETTNNALTREAFDRIGVAPPETVKQNWTGGTFAIRRDAFEAVGGFDESFTGWTGEDREFYDRCQVLNGMFHSYVPFLHLWHAPQAGRVDKESLQKANSFTASKLAITRDKRIAELKSLQPICRRQDVMS